MEGLEIFEAVKEMLAEGKRTMEIVHALEPYGIVKQTVLRYIERVKTNKPPKRGGKKPPEETQGPPPVIIIAPTESGAVIPQVVPRTDGTENHADQIIHAAQDMRQLRRQAMNKADKDAYDPRIAIGAATAEAQILMSAAKLAKEMRDTARDDIVHHPQHANFREQLLAIFEGTEIAVAIKNAVEQAMAESKKGIQ